MREFHRRQFLSRTVLGAGAIAGLSLLGLAAAQTPTAAKWTCPPCGCGNDAKEFDAPGLCSVCGMPMVQKTAAATPADDHDHPAGEPKPQDPRAPAEPATPPPQPAVSSPKPQ